MLLLLEFLAEMLMLKRGQKHIIIKLLSCVFSDLKRIIADITGPGIQSYTCISRHHSTTESDCTQKRCDRTNTETISWLLGKWVGGRKGRATETQTFVRSEDWDLVHQSLSASLPLRHDVRCVSTTCSSSVPLPFIMYRIAFHVCTKSYEV